MLGERDLRQLDDLLARSPLAIIAWDASFRVSFWSKRAAEMFGYAASDVLGKRAEDLQLIFPEDIPGVAAVQQRLLEPGTHYLVNVNRNVRADGTIRTCRWSTFAVQDHPDFHFLAYVEDITEVEVAQKALAQSEARFRSLFEYNPDIIMVFSADGTIADVNYAITKISGAPRERVIGKHFSSFLDPRDVPIHQAYLERALRGEMLSYRARAHALDGRPLDLAVTTVPEFRNGTLFGAFSIIRDVTEQVATREQIEQQQLALAEKEARLRSLFEHNPDRVYSIDRDGTILDINNAADNLSVRPRDAIVGQNFLAFLSTPSVDPALEVFRDALEGRPGSVPVEINRVDGTTRELNLTMIPQFEAGSVVGVYAIGQDETDRKRAERRVELVNQRIRDLYFIATSGEFPERRLRASLELGTKVFEVSVGAVVDTTGEAPAIEAAFRSEGGESVPDERLIDIAMGVCAMEGVPLPVLVDDGVALRLEVEGVQYGALIFAGEHAPLREITSTQTDLLGLIATLIAGTIHRSRQRAQLRTMAYFDSLTGLPNRLFVMEKLRDAIEVAESRLERVAVLFLDLDRFKDVNDTLGHAHGDELIKLVAERLVAELGPSIALARMGGDEFVALLTEARDVDRVRDIAEHIVAAVTEPFPLEGYEQFISASIGIALYPEDGHDEQTLIKNADIAMYRAKDRGRNGYYFYNPTLEAPIHMRLSQEKLLRRALEIDEFVVFYQPLQDLRTGEIVSVEALVRWNHPKSGLIEPSHFIPSAEMSGLIVPLGDWVLATAAKQMRAWHDTLGPLRLAVNLSARQFYQRDLRAHVLAILEKAGLDPRFIEFEITESVAMSDAAQTVGIVRDLNEAGIRIAVDDFGTGYSSLAYLRRFALDVLKIDRSFVAGVGHDAFDETIVKTVIGMAHSLGLEVVAEGVETELQMAFLAANQCDLVQGYLLSRPLPARELEEHVTRQIQPS